jgi:dTDP-4-dehydrorhamnose reductase
MKIAVTGAGGQLGSELCRLLGDRAVALDLPEFDLTDCDLVLRMLESIHADAVVNTAAYTLVDKAEDEPEVCRLVNTLGTRHLADACRTADCPLVQISTDYVFDGVGRSTPYQETDEPRPRGVYAQSKLEAERFAAACPKHFVVRTSGLYGRPGPRSPGNFVLTMLRLAESHTSLRVVDDQRCTPSYVSHVARAVEFLLDTTAYGTYHVVNSGETTWHGMAAEIFRQSGLSVRLESISTAEYAARAPRPAYSVLDTSKYLALEGRPALPRWQDALAEFLGSL